MMQLILFVSIVIQRRLWVKLSKLGLSQIIIEWKLTRAGRQFGLEVSLPQQQTSPHRKDAHNRCRPCNNPPPSFRRPCLKRYCSRNSGFTKLDRTQKLSVDWASLNARGRKERLAFTASHAPPHLPRNALLFVDKRRKAQRAPRRVRSHEI